MTFGVERDLARRGIDTARTRGATYADVGGALTGQAVAEERTIVTGMTRDGAFLIENGEIAGATQY